MKADFSSECLAMRLFTLSRVGQVTVHICVQMTLTGRDSETRRLEPDGSGFVANPPHVRCLAYDRKEAKFVMMRAHSATYYIVMNLLTI